MVKVYKPLFELGRIVTGKTPKTNVVDYWGGNIPFITPTDIVGYNSYYQYETERYVTKKGLDTQKATLLPANSVCFSCIASIGKACLTRTFSITNQQINSIIPNDKNDYRYILYLLRYNLPYVQMIAGGSGSGTPIISKRKFEKFKFLIEDDLKIQHRIASILSAYDSLIENNTKRIRLLEKMAENLYKEWFVRFRFPGYEKAEMENGLPKGWKVERLGEWGISLDTGKRPKGGVDISLKDGYPSLGAECIKELAFFDYSSVSLIPKDFYESMKRGKNTGDDILLYKDGAYIGKVTMFMDKYPYEHYAINEHVFFVAPKNVEYKNYLYFTLHQNEFFVLMQNLNRNAAQPGLSRGDVERVQMTIPTSEMVKQFNQVVKPMLKIMFNLAKQNTLLARRRDLLLPRLMSGKLEVKP